MNHLSGPLYLMPAYGKIYETKDQAIQDWMAGKDFKIVGDGYCSIRDKENLRWDASTVWIMWNRVDAVRIM